MSAGIEDSNSLAPLNVSILFNNFLNLKYYDTAIIMYLLLDYKEGGELYFSDMYVDRELPQSIKKHKELWG